MQNSSKIKTYAILIMFSIAIIFYKKSLAVLSLMTSLAYLLVNSLLSGRASTLTEFIFILALLFFGPIYGFIGARQINNEQTSVIVRVLAFLFCLLTAYLGWLLGGMFASDTYPHYPNESPGELVALIYTIPGFVTGIIAIVITRFIARFRIPVRIAVYGIIVTLLFIMNLYLFVMAFFPRQD